MDGLALEILRRVGDVLLVCGACLAVWGLWMLIRQPRIVFRPSPSLGADPSDLGLPFEEVRPRLPDGTRLHGWWLPAASSDDRVILLFPGSIGNISHELPTAAFLRGLGASILIVDYPGFGHSEGWPSERGCYLAAAAVYDYATRQRGAAADRTIVFGRSLGGSVAAWLAARHACARLVLHGAFTSVADVAARAYPFFPVRYFCYIRFDTLKHLRGCRCPVIVLHSPTDRVIPAVHAERILRGAPGTPRFLPLRGDHYGDDWQKTPGLGADLRRLLVDEGA